MKMLKKLRNKLRRNECPVSNAERFLKYRLRKERKAAGMENKLEIWR